MIFERYPQNLGTKGYFGDLVKYSFTKMSGLRTRFQRLERELKAKYGKANTDKRSKKLGCEREKGKMTVVACGRKELEDDFVCLILSALFLK